VYIIEQQTILTKHKFIITWTTSMSSFWL